MFIRSYSIVGRESENFTQYADNGEYSSNPTTNIRIFLQNRREESRIAVHIIERDCGVGAGTIKNILAGQAKSVRTKTVLAIADYFNCSLDELTKRSLCKEEVRSSNQKTWANRVATTSKKRYGRYI